MRVGASLSLFALGAILAFAVRSNPSGFNFNTAGVVLMFVGLVGLALTAWWTSQRRTSQVITRTPRNQIRAAERSDRLLALLIDRTRPAMTNLPTSVVTDLPVNGASGWII